MTTPVLDEALEAAITAWLTDDPDPATQLALTHLRDRARDGDPSALAEITDAFAGPLTFGTAGLRGALGPGPGRMNRVVVARAAAGLAGYLVDQGLAGGRVIVGYDARYNSDVFAADTAEILAGAGLKPLLCHQHQPTPVVAFGIRHYGCVAGVIVTASHNPPQDNGYKVYLGDGSQIVPPADADIAAEALEQARHAETRVTEVELAEHVTEPAGEHRPAAQGDQVEEEARIVHEQDVRVLALQLGGRGEPVAEGLPQVVVGVDDLGRLPGNDAHAENPRTVHPRLDGQARTHDVADLVHREPHRVPVIREDDHRTRGARAQVHRRVRREDVQDLFAVACAAPRVAVRSAR